MRSGISYPRQRNPRRSLPVLVLCAPFFLIVCTFSPAAHAQQVIEIVQRSDGAEAPLVNGQFEVIRTGGTTGALTINLELDLTVSSAAEGSDFTFAASLNAVTFADGQGNVFINVMVINDAVQEPDEIVVVNVLPGAGYAVGVLFTDTVTITSDESRAGLGILREVWNTGGSAQSEPMETTTGAVTRARCGSSF